MSHIKWLVILIFISSTKSQILVDKNEDIDTPYPLAPEHDDGVRIAGGKISKRHQFPFMVRIYIWREGAKHRVFCGATLISPRFVLTAAHCLNGSPVLIQARLGAFRPDQYEKTQVRVRTSKFLVHPDYKPNAYLHDIGLIDLEEPVPLNDDIKIIRLAKGPETYAGHKGLAAGWGKTAYGQRSKVLRYTTNDILNNTYCGLLEGDTITDVHVCMDGKGHRGICNSDSGGPLTTSDGATQVGITSFFDSECGEAASSIFTRVSKYYDWIKYNTDIDY